MTNLVAKLGTDMTAWADEFADSITSEIIGGQDETHFTLISPGQHRYDFAGSGITYDFGSGEAVPDGGTLTALTLKRPINSHWFPIATMSGFSVSAVSVMDLFYEADWDGIQALLFSGDDTLKGSKYNDHLLGFDGNDTFDMTLSGADTVEGGDGDDWFDFGILRAGDFVDGGDGTDFLSLGVNVSGVSIGIILLDTNVQNVEVLILADGNSYAITLDDPVVPAAGMTIDASGLGSDHFLNLFAEDVQAPIICAGGAGGDFIIGGQGADELSGREGNDTFDLTHGGNDTVGGGDGDDSFDFGNSMFTGDGTTGDFVDGGDNADTLKLSLNNATSEFHFTFDDTVIRNLERVEVAHGSGGFCNLRVSVADSAIPSAGLTIDGSALDENVFLHVTRIGAIGTGSLKVLGGAGKDTLIGTVGDDSLYGGDNEDSIRIFQGGADAAYGGNGDDSIVCGARTDVTVDGGTGRDEVVFDTEDDPSVPSLIVEFTAPFFQNFESVALYGVCEYDLRIDDSAIGGAGIFVFVDLDPDMPGVHVSMTNSLSDKALFGHGGDGADIFTGGAARDLLDGSDGADVLTGGGGEDSLRGDDGDDSLNGGALGDTLEGGEDADRFLYARASDSTGNEHDKIRGFDAAEDFIGESFAKFTNGVDARVKGGSLSEDTFDRDLHDAMAGHLGKRHALIFKPDDGDFAGDTFLVIDVNNKAGYQVGKDIVILLEEPTHLNRLNADNFFHDL